jgi:hypothetical protein
MPAANVQEVQSFIETHKDSDDVKNLIGGFITPERVNAFLDSENGLKLIQPRLDKYHTKGLDTWKEKNLSKLIEDEISKRNPAETEEQKRLRKIEEENREIKNNFKKETLKNSALKNLKNTDLAELVDFFIGEDDVSTSANLTTLENVVNKIVDGKITLALKNGGRIPGDGDGNSGGNGMNAMIRKAAGRL